MCHHHGHLARLSLDSFFIFAKSNSLHTLIDLIFLLILSIHVTLILSYPYIFAFLISRSLSFPQKCWLFHDVIEQDKTKDYLLVRRRTIFLGQLEGDLSPDQLIGQLLNLDGHESARERDRNGHLVLLDLQLLA